MLVSAGGTSARLLFVQFRDSWWFRSLSVLRVGASGTVPSQLMPSGANHAIESTDGVLITIESRHWSVQDVREPLSWISAKLSSGVLHRSTTILRSRSLPSPWPFPWCRGGYAADLAMHYCAAVEGKACCDWVLRMPLLRSGAPTHLRRQVPNFALYPD